MVLASASPRRLEILRSRGVRVTVVPSGFDESSVRGLSPRHQALAAARGKAIDVVARRRGALVIAADTVVALGPDALGKPDDHRHAAAMLARLAGRDHSVHTAICVVSAGGRRAVGLSSSVVRVQRLDRSQVSRYVASGEPIGKAGGYAIQGQAAEFARVIRGRRDTVVGLSLRLLHRLLVELGEPLANSLSDNLDPS